MKPLQEGEAVLLVEPLIVKAATADGFNPHYGLVVKDLGWGEPNNDPDTWDVIVLWEDGRERTFPRKFLMSWSEIPDITRPSTI